MKVFCDVVLLPVKGDDELAIVNLLSFVEVAARCEPYSGRVRR